MYVVAFVSAAELSAIAALGGAVLVALPRRRRQRRAWIRARAAGPRVAGKSACR
jgi:hypothetical protein